MKRFIIVALTLMFSIGIQAQDYIPYPDSLATWNSYLSLHTEPDDLSTQVTFDAYNYHLEGDTIINDTTYSKLYVRKSWYSLHYSGPPEPSTQETNYSQVDHPYVFIGGIREDSTKKVWYRNVNFDNWGNTEEPFPWYFHKTSNDFLPTILEENAEIMLYDFGIDIGDSIHFYKGGCGSIWEVLDTIIVDDVLNRRNYIFNHNGVNLDNITWVEGIGDIINDPLSRLDLSSCGGLGFNMVKGLSCFSENGNQIYTDEEYEYPIDCEGAIFVGIEEFENQTLEIFPNPSEGEYIIKLPGHSSYQLSIFNSIGELVKTKRNIQGQNYSLDLTYLPNGIYLVKMESDNAVYSSRVVKE